MTGDLIQWELVNPEGACRPVSITPACRPTTLEGKTVGLAWNGKPGGNEALEEIAALLSEQAKGIKFIRYWETLPESWAVVLRELDEETIQAMAALKPDVVIVAQGD